MEQPLVQAKHTSIDDILENKIGFGAGQKKLINSLYVLLFSEGCETIVLGLLLPKLGVEWELSNFDKSLLITMVYFGVSLGSYLETFSDKYGRYNFLLVDAIITSVFGFLSCICTSFSWFVAVRFFYGIGIGIALPLTATYITEVVPGSKRATILSYSRVYWSLGCVFACVAGWLLLAHNNWRILLFVLCFPSFYALYDIKVNCKESLRFMWVKGDFDGSFQVLNMISDLNQVDRIAESELRELFEVQKSENLHKEEQNSCLVLLNNKYLQQTLILAFAWTAVCFLYYSVMLMLPSILSRNEGFSENLRYVFLIFISVVESVAFYGSQLVMDHPDFGRKKSIYLGFGIMFLLSVLIVAFGEGNTTLLMLIFVGFKVFSTSCFMILYPYSAQIYETLVRSQAMGIFSICGRLATTFLGVIGISALQWADGKGLYYIFVFLTFFATLLIYQMPYCTLGRRLDS